MDVNRAKLSEAPRFPLIAQYPEEEAALPLNFGESKKIWVPKPLGRGEGEVLAGDKERSAPDSSSIRVNTTRTAWPWTPPHQAALLIF